MKFKEAPQEKKPFIDPNPTRLYQGGGQPLTDEERGANMEQFQKDPLMQRAAERASFNLETEKAEDPKTQTEMEPAKTLEQQRQEFVENILQPARALLDIKEGLDDDKKRQLLRSTEDMANNMFLYENIKATMGLTEDDIQFMANAQNPYNYMAMSNEEKERLYRIQARVEEGKEIFQKKYIEEPLSERGTMEETVVRQKVLEAYAMKDNKETEEANSSGKEENILEDINEYAKRLEHEGANLGEQIKATLDEIDAYQREGAARPWREMLKVNKWGEHVKQWEDLQIRLNDLYRRNAWNVKVQGEIQAERWREGGKIKNAKPFMEKFRKEMETANENVAHMLKKVDGFSPNAKVRIYVSGKPVEGYVSEINYSTGTLTLYKGKFNRDATITIDTRHVEKIKKVGIGRRIRSALGL